ncbi:hypothetical protein Y886_34345 [Xanthomonas hyacinthi DSM 19077]|nr:hypothetical protein Y886_34345 [Xanthomonas hyacinthi DSM 19077]
MVALLVPAATAIAAPPGAVSAAGAVIAVHASVPGTSILDIPRTTPRVAPIADELIPPVPYTARTVAFVKTFVVTATYDDRPYRVMVVMVDSEGLVYSTSQQGGRSVTDAESPDALKVRVTSLSPVVFDVAVYKAEPNATATRERVAVGDLEQGHSAFALRENKLAVRVERLEDEVDLR